MCESTLTQTSRIPQQPDCDADAALARARRETTLCRARQCRIEASVALYRADDARDEATVARWHDERARLLDEATRLEADGAR